MFYATFLRRGYLLAFNNCASIIRAENMKFLIPYMVRLLEIISMKGSDRKFMWITLMYYNTVQQHGKVRF